MRRLARSIGVPVPWDVTGRQLIDWVGRQEWQAETRRSYYQTFRKFWDWGRVAGYATENAAAELPSVAPSKPNPGRHRMGSTGRRSRTPGRANG